MVRRLVVGITTLDRVILATQSRALTSLGEPTKGLCGHVGHIDRGDR